MKLLVYLFLGLLRELAPGNLDYAPQEPCYAPVHAAFHAAPGNDPSSAVHTGGQLKVEFKRQSGLQRVSGRIFKFSGALRGIEPEVLLEIRRIGRASCRERV